MNAGIEDKIQRLDVNDAANDESRIPFARRRLVTQGEVHFQGCETKGQL